MGRWLAPLVGVVGLLSLVVGVVSAELDHSGMGGVPLVGAGAGLVLVAGALAAVVVGLTRHRNTLPRR